MSNEKKLFLVIALLYILYTIIPIIQDFTGLDIWMINLATFTILFILNPRAFANKIFYWFLAYATILLLYVLTNKPLAVGIGTVQDSKKLIIEYAFILPSISIFCILYYWGDVRLYKIISVATILSLLISFIYLIPILYSNSGILRQSLYLKQRIIGIPSYPLMHAYVIIVPAILYGFKVLKTWHKTGIFLMAILTIFIIVNTHITTNLIILISILSINFLYDSENNKRSLVLIFLFFLLLYILHISGVLINLFDLLINIFKGTAVHSKLKDFKLLYITGDIGNSSNIAVRSNLHDISWVAFFKNILFGTSPVGNHSSLLDRLGGMGLFAFVPFIMIILTHINYILYIIKNFEARIYYFLGLFAVFILLYQKGLFGQEGWLFMMILLPCSIITFVTDKKSKPFIERII